jgi:hypothetical protein
MDRALGSGGLAGTRRRWYVPRRDTLALFTSVRSAPVYVDVYVPAPVPII